MESKLTSKVFMDALKENKLVGLKCLDCGTITVPPKMVCRRCTSTNMETVTLKGNGKIQTFTTVNVAAEGRENELPYLIVLVEMEEGPWIMGNLTGVDPAAVTMEQLIDKNVVMEKSEVFPGDKYSAGESARPIFKLV